MNVDFSVLNSIMLVLLVVLTVASYFVMIYFRGKRALHFGNLNTLARVHGFKRFHLSPGVLIIKVLIVCMLFLVATGAITVNQGKQAVGVDYVILLDASSSMLNTDYYPNRLAAAKETAIDWLEILPGSAKVGLLAFSKDIQNQVPLTHNVSTLIKEIENVQVDYTKSGTSLNLALNYGLTMLNETGKNRTILLLTDGTEEFDNNTIKLAQDLEVKVYIFGIGKQQEGSKPPPAIPEEFRELYSDEAYFDFAKLQMLAESTGGKAFQSTTTEELKEYFNTATLEEVQVPVNSSYYLIILIAVLSILELLIYSKIGGL
ncbi:VWA domain-containing protein [Candidatus Woesearchaeota archaeon]|nr:VWA domain-containing protein [Candidatus Woesearchaeota archaeon]